MKIILASQSPRRRQLLTQIGIHHEVMPSNADEKINEPKPDILVKALAMRKAEAVSAKVSGAIIIAADTVVYTEDNKILEKPSNEEDAFAMLKALQDSWHTVYTGVALINTLSGKRQSFVEAAAVLFRPLSDDEIRRYVATGEPMDKAGAYGVQERGAMLVKRVEGDYFTVVGLPLARLCIALKEWGIEI